MKLHRHLKSGLVVFDDWILCCVWELFNKYALVQILLGKPRTSSGLLHSRSKLTEIHRANWNAGVFDMEHSPLPHGYRKILLFLKRTLPDINECQAR